MPEIYLTHQVKERLRCEEKSRKNWGKFHILPKRFFGCCLCLCPLRPNQLQLSNSYHFYLSIRLASAWSADTDLLSCALQVKCLSITFITSKESFLDVRCVRSLDLMFVPLYAEGAVVWNRVSYIQIPFVIAGRWGNVSRNEWAMFVWWLRWGKTGTSPALRKILLNIKNS